MKFTSIKWLNPPNEYRKLTEEIERLKRLGYTIYEERGRWYAYNEEGGFEICYV